jgi:TonB family protein
MAEFSESLPDRLNEQTAPLAAGAPQVTLLWALAASALLHTAFVAMPLVKSGDHPTELGIPGPALQATLAPQVVAAPEPQVEPQPVAIVAANLSATPQDVVPTPPTPVPIPASAPQAPSPIPGAVGAIDLRADGQPLEDRVRLGDLLTRQMSEFPVELDFPVRLNQTIRARYPPGALAAGREDTVVVWIVVNPQGMADEIQITEGSEEFANAVRAAVNEARFLPAQNNLVKIRYPVSFEFHFVIGPHATPDLPSVPAIR